MSIQMNYLLPAWLTVALSIGLLGAMAYGTIMLLRKRVARNWVIALSSLRFAIFLTFLLILMQPAFSFTSNSAQLPEMIVLVDTSPNMNRPGVKGTRLDEARASLQKGELADALKSRYRLHWFALDGTARPMEEDELAALKANGGVALYAESMDAACKQVRALGKNPQRVLLVSDGHDHSQLDPVETARALGVSVDVLAPAPPQSSADPVIAIIDVQSARRVLLGSDTIFRVTLEGKQSTSNDRTLSIRVTEDGKKILDHPLVLKAGRVEETVQLAFRPAAAGLKQYEFSLIDSAAKPYPLAVQVLDNKYEVLILEDRWRWEYKYLHRLFEDDPSFRFSALLNRGGGAFVQFGSPDRRVNLVGFPQSRSDLEGFDTFVLGDVDPAKWPRGLANDLARLVADEGRSLVVIAGPNLAKVREIPELHAILPVELAAEAGQPVDGPIDVRIRSDSGASPFFFQLGEGEKLPAVDQVYPSVRKRPGATVLLEAVKHRNAYGNIIVIAEHTVGRGRVLFLGTDTLWKWHTLAPLDAGPTPYSIFWQQAFRAMTPARSSAGTANLWLTPSRSRVEVGRPVVLRAELQSSRALSATTLQAVAITADEKRLPLVFTADPANPRSFRAEFTCSSPGLLRISASAFTEGKGLAEGFTSLQVSESHGDEGDLGIDLTNLARIAQDSGGRVIDPAVSETWPTPAGESLPPVPQFHTVDLWSNFTLMLVLCGLLGADWFIRLFKGLVSG